MFLQRVNLKQGARWQAHINKTDPPKAIAPPVLIVHGEADDVVPIGESEKMYSLLSHHGIEVKLVRVPGAGHEIGCYLPEIWSDIHDFVKQHLGFHNS
jgi:dipeptidyl aminopeptidase/acylaminoacyl peptidase